MEFEDCGKRQISISKLAKLMGYSRSHVQAVIVGKYPVSDKFLYKLKEIKIEDVLKHNRSSKAK